MNALRKALELRYHLLPYIYDIAHEDLPILRPLVLEFPNDPMCRELTDQFMLGDRLLAAPVMTPGVTKRAVYLPKGTWYDFYTGKRYAGGRYILADAPLDRIPLFANSGAAIPVSDGTPQCSDEITKQYLKVFPGRGEWLHFTDDGVSYAYRSGAYHCLKVSVRGCNVTQTVTHRGYAGDDLLKVDIF